MPTRLFFHAATNALSGTFPTDKQSAALTATKSVSGQGTLFTMNSITGTSQVLRSVSGSATVAAQSLFCAFFCSDTFDADQPVGGGNQLVTLNIANRESSTSMDFGEDLRTSVYVWRPSTGSVVGYVHDGGAMTGNAEPSNSLAIRVNQGVVTSTATVMALAGDVLICEVWQQFVQASGVLGAGTIYWDGTIVNTTTNASVSSHASFLDLSASTLTFGTPPVLSISCSFGQSLAAATQSAAGGVVVAGSFANTLASITLTASASVPHASTLSQTLADATIAGTGLVGASLGTFANTLASVTLTASASIPHVSTFANTLASVTLTASAVVPHVAAYSNTLATVSLTGEGIAADPASSEGTLDTTLAAATMSGAGAVVDPITGTFDNAMAAATMAATGSNRPQAQRATHDASAGSGAAATGERKKFVVPSVEQVPYVDRMFDDLKRQPAPKVVETPNLVPRSTLIADSLARMAPTSMPAPGPAPLPQVEVIEPDDDSDMLMIAMLL
jgi:hypothetical protein